jgi:hypothetical protein
MPDCTCLQSYTNQPKSKSTGEHEPSRHSILGELINFSNATAFKFIMDFPKIGISRRDRRSGLAVGFVRNYIDPLT